MKRLTIVMIVVAAAAVILLPAAAVFAVLAVGASDVMSNTATGSETLTPAGTATGKALVVYTPGLTGAAKGAAAQVAADLKARDYAVTLAGVKSEAAADYAGYDVIVVGAPIYSFAGGAIPSYLQALDPAEGVKVGAVATGSRDPDPFPDAAWLKVTVQLPQGKDTDQLLAGFVDELLG